MGILVINGEEYSRNIPLLLRDNSLGRIHSVFKNGFNIKVDSSLIFIGNDKNGKIPFGIHLRTVDIDQIVDRAFVGATTYFDKVQNKLIFPEINMAINLSQTKSYNNDFTKIKEESIRSAPHLDILLEVLLEQNEGTGLGIEIDHFIEAYQGVVPLTTTEQQILLLMEAVINQEETVDINGIKFFLGRGKGLTPSGDDLIIGLMAVMDINDRISTFLRNKLTHLIMSEEITTDISKEFLFYALRGEFSSVVKDAVFSLYFDVKETCKSKIKNLLTTGHSSGLDTAFGMLVGLITLRRNSYMKKVVIALGGNAILQPKQEATYENQLNNIKKSCEVIAKIIESGNQVTITHGNGPQVGNILRQNEEAKHVVPPFPLDICNSETQGFIGYMIENSLRNELQKLNIDKQVVTLLTEVEVSEDDPAFKNPTKPIGVFYSEEEAKKMASEKGWAVKEDAGRGWRRVVPSPVPKSIIGSDVIKSLANAGNIVIASGGGGIPVVKKNGELVGIEAVIDKDRSGFKLAQEIGADVFMILTDVDNVFVNYGKPNQKALETVTLEEIKQYLEEGQFSAGSMGPKVESAVAFAETGGTAIICSLEKADAALAGELGTRISSKILSLT